MAELNEDEYMDHWLYYIVPKNAKAAKGWRLIFAPFWIFMANFDDGIFGDTRKSGSKWWAEWSDKPPSVWRAARWWFRNPFHFLFFNVIGFQWMLEPGEFFKYTPLIHTSDEVVQRSVWVQGEEGFSLGFRGWGLPFMSYRKILSEKKQMEFYMGYRERGNLGFAFRINTRKK